LSLLLLLCSALLPMSAWLLWWYSMLSLRVSHSLEQYGGARYRFNAFHKCDQYHEPPMFPISYEATFQTASLVYRSSPCAHSISKRTLEFVLRVDRISWKSLASLVAVGFSQIEQQVRAVGSSSVNDTTIAGVALTSGLLLG
jgi:hypothetical protein